MPNLLVVKSLTLVLLSGVVVAENDEEALIKSCQQYIKADDLPEDSVCYEYINGFIDGAVITDTAIIENIAAESEMQGSDFFRRAYKTRLGDRGKNPPPTYFAKFCLPEAVTRHDIVRTLVQSLDGNALSKTPFREQLYTALKKVYACE